MSDEGLQQARDKMAAAGVDPVAIEVFAHYYRLVESGETGMIPESTIEPLDTDALADVEVPDDVAREAIGRTVVIKLNGGLGTSMGMDRAKSLLDVRDGLSFLDIIARQVLAVREKYDAPLPLIFMNSFRTSADTREVARALPRAAGRRPPAGVPAEQGAQAPRGRPHARRLAGGPGPRVVPAGPRRHLHRAARDRPARPADRRRLHPGLRVQLRQPRCGAGPPGRRLVRPRPVRRSRSRPSGAPRRTARAATSRPAGRTAGSCCARPPRRSTRTRTRWAT